MVRKSYPQDISAFAATCWERVSFLIVVLTCGAICPAWAQGTNPVPSLRSSSPTQAVAGATIPITLNGNGFVSNTAILVNGVVVPSTYQSSTGISAQITAAAGSSGNLAIQALSPSPGGGTSATMQLPIATLQITATDPDGTNTGTAQLGVPVTLTTTNTDTAHTTISWSLQGGGKISSASLNGASGALGTYTPPQTMPSSSSVMVTAYLTNLPALTTSYTLNLINPPVTVTSAKQTQLLTGGTQTVTLIGSGFVPGTTVLLNGTALPVAYISYTQASIQVTVGANATGTLTFQVQNPTPGGGSPVSYSLPIAVNSIALAPTSQTGPVVALGGSIKMGATVTGSMQTAVTWGVVGDGTISSTGTYVAPATMSTGSAVVTAALTSNPSITASYPLTLVNPVPVVNNASPNQAVAGGAVSMTLSGTGFVPGTVIVVNGTAVPTTYNSPTSVVAQITGPAGSSANLSVQAQNPSPGGGTGAAFQMPVATLQLTATNPSGTNTGTAMLGVPVNFAAANTDTAHTGVLWTLQGAGTLTGSGFANGSNNANAVYTPPAQMPANPSVTVIAYLQTLPALTTSYTFTLINPALVVTSATPTQLATGGTQTVTLIGSGFVSGTTVSLNGTALLVTNISNTQESVQVPVAANATGTLTLQVQNPASAVVPFSLPIAVNSIALAPTTQTGPVVALGGTLGMGATVTGSMQTAVTWGVVGDGTISSTGTYVAPATMSTGSAVITAALTSNPAITASYPLTLVNPVPVVNYASPTQAVAGGAVSMTLTGTGFVPGTVILVNGTSVPTTYNSPTSVVAQITGPAGSSANLSVQAQNPSPGGGTGAAFQMPVATLQLTATNPSGTNTGTAMLGVPVNFAAANTDTAHTGVLWTLQGAGTLTGSGFTNGSNNANAVYTPPAQMPANPSVTVIAYLQTLPALTTSYTFTLINPVPVVTSATPTQLATGGTQTVTLTGSSFVSGTTVLFNGTALPITYISSTQATVQVPVPANATGTLSLQVQNPAPGGGAGNTFTETVASASIALTATGEDGVNTGNAVEDYTVAMSASVSGTMQTAVNWSVVGAGSITSAGVYTPPQAIPNNPVATIYATLAANPAVTASYTVNIVNPVPTLTASSLSMVPAGESTSVTFTGSSFVTSTVIQVNGAVVPTTYVSSTSLIAQLTIGDTATGTLSVQAYTPAPSGGVSNPVYVGIAVGISETAAARLLDQTTFGPTTSLIQHVQSEGVNAWLTEQYNTPQTVLPVIPAKLPSYTGAASSMAESEWWQTAITGNDQLRQRVAFALSQLFVISTDTVTGWDIQYYMNMLAQDAFSNWYTIMNDVTLSPGMGNYLDMLNSAKPTATLIADENYARENMQLFNLGLDLLNQDGSLQLDANGNPIPTYTQAQVQAFARAYTGWTYANSDGSTPASFNKTINHYYPMVAVESQHDQNPKTLLNGTVLPAGQTAEADLAGALTNIFQHPNLPPFVCQQLIQHLVKSDPSPGYISRVAAVFMDDGSGIRGDMQAVFTAIFTDPEARAGDTAPQPGDGHLREPILWMTNITRGLGFVNVDPNNYWQNLSNKTVALGERPFQSPAVFNFFPPNYVIPGTSLNAPEFGLENTANVVGRLTLANNMVFNYIGGFNVDLSATSPLGQIAASQGPAALVSALNNLFLYGTMDSNTAAAITGEISTVTNPAQQVRLATYLVLTCPEYLVLH